jgi:hypothetical protein
LTCYPVIFFNKKGNFINLQNLNIIYIVYNIKRKGDIMSLEVNALNNVNSASADASVAAAPKDASGAIAFPQYNAIDDENYHRAKIVKQETENNFKNLKGRMELHDNWYHAIVGEDYVTFQGDGKMTYGELREKLGIPPRALRERNGGKNTDADVIKGKIEIELNDIGWFERRMDDMEAADARAMRAHGMYRAGWERTVSNKELINWFNEK